MGDRFEERFKGKTTKLDKQGLDGLTQKAGQPAAKGPPMVNGRTGSEMPRESTAATGAEGSAPKGNANQNGANRFMQRALSNGRAPVGKADSPMAGGPKKKPVQASPGQSGPSGKSQVITEAGSHLMRENPSAGSFAMPQNYQNGHAQGGGHSNPAATYSPGKFQQNAFMAMNSYQQGTPSMGMHAVPPVFQVPMGAMQYAYPPGTSFAGAQNHYGSTGPGAPGVYIVPQYAPQSQMMYAMPNMISMGGHMHGQQSLGLRAAHTYFTSPNDMAEVQRKYGLTEQGDFKRGLGEYIPTKGGVDKRKFTPYTVEEYKTLSRTHNTKLGGLGANFNEDWEAKAKKNEKTKEFSNMIRGINSEKISKQISLRSDTSSKPNEPNPKSQEDKAALAREKALAFAKTVPKPKPKKREGMGDERNPQQEGQGTQSGGGPGGANGKKPVVGKKLDEEINRVEDDLEALERQHLFYQEKINKLKS